MLIAARAMQGALDILRPLLAETGAKPIGKFLMGTVKGDVHDIGKNLCNIMLEGAGFEVIDLGVNVPPERFVEQINEHEPDVVGFSAFLTTTMPMFKANINALQKAGIRDKVIVMVGGAPVTQEYADAVGADGYSADASSAVKKAKQLIEQRARRRCRPDGHRPALRTSKTITIGAGQPFCIIGERINPTGRKKLRRGAARAATSHGRRRHPRAGRGGRRHARRQRRHPARRRGRAARADAQTIQAESDIPLCIDSSVIEALEAGLAVYEGKALVNSVTGEDDRLEEILPLVAKHGAAVIGLANDETGIPETPQQRLEIATKIVGRGGDHGIGPEDVVIDPLAMTVGADTEAVTTTLETIRLIRDKLGVNMSLGASNVSFGLPQRHVLNAAFLPMAMAAGLTSAIMSTAPVCVESVRAADLLLGHDPWGTSWIAAHRARQAGRGG